MPTTIKCLAQGHNTVLEVRREPLNLRLITLQLSHCAIIEKNSNSNFLLVSFVMDLSSTENVLSIILINEDKNNCQPINFENLFSCAYAACLYRGMAKKPGLQHFKGLDVRNRDIVACEQ